MNLINLKRRIKGAKTFSVLHIGHFVHSLCWHRDEVSFSFLYLFIFLVANFVFTRIVDIYAVIESYCRYCWMSASNAQFTCQFTRIAKCAYVQKYRLDAYVNRFEQDLKRTLLRMLPAGVGNMFQAALMQEFCGVWIAFTASRWRHLLLGVPGHTV